MTSQKLRIVPPIIVIFVPCGKTPPSMRIFASLSKIVLLKRTNVEMHKVLKLK